MIAIVIKPLKSIHGRPTIPTRNRDLKVSCLYRRALKCYNIFETFKSLNSDTILCQDYAEKLSKGRRALRGEESLRTLLHLLPSSNHLMLWTQSPGGSTPQIRRSEHLFDIENDRGILCGRCYGCDCGCDCAERCAGDVFLGTLSVAQSMAWKA